MKQTLLLIRHGQTTWNADHILPGQLPGIELNDKGREQAARLANALALIPISAIITSPLERARDTAEIINQGRDLTIQLEPNLMDTNVGRWAGQKFDELAKIDPDWKAYVQDPSVAPEGIETFPQVEAGKAGKLFIDNASVSLVEIDSEQLQHTRVIAVGWSPHPGWLKPAIVEAKKDKEDTSLNENNEIL